MFSLQVGLITPSYLRNCLFYIFKLRYWIYIWSLIPKPWFPQFPCSISRRPTDTLHSSGKSCKSCRKPNRTSSKSSESTNASLQTRRDRPHPGSFQIINRSGDEKGRAIASRWCFDARSRLRRKSNKQGIARKWRVPLIFLFPFCPPPTLEDSFEEFTSMLKQNLYMYPQHTYICLKQY